MDDWLLPLFALAVVLTVVTLVGHGIWVLVAWLFGGGRPDTSSQSGADTRSPSRPTLDRVATGTVCPRCGSSLSMRTRECIVCAWPRPLAAGTRHGAVRAELEARLARLETLGMIDAATRRDLSASIASHLAEAPIVDVPIADKPVVTAPVEDRAETDSHEPGIVVAEVVEAEVVEPVLAAPEASTAPVQERARQYAAARERARTERDSDEESVVDRRPRRDASEVLAAFMQERNIRWGELVGGLLIVCCSIALVISFWAEIATRPLLKFVIFNGVSAALFGAGFYTLRRWQIHTTSRGLLIIATLLVPLNFLAIAALTQQAPPTDALSIGGELLSLGVFTALVYLAARTLTPAAPVMLTVSVMLTSLMQLVTRRFGADDLAGGDFGSVALVYVLALVPIGCYVASTGLPLVRLWRAADTAADEGAAPDNHMFIVLGVASYAALLPLGLLVYQSGAIVDALSRLSPLVAVLGLPALVTGLLFWRRASRSEAAGQQTVGIAVGVAGAMVMAVAIGLAWPDPALLLPTTLTIGALFAVVAVVFDIPAAHAVTAGCAIAAWLVGFHVLRGNIGWQANDGEQVARALLSAASGNALVPLAALFAGVAYGCRQLSRTVDAHWYIMVTAGTAALSLALAVGYGFARSGDPTGVSWTLGIYTIAAAIATYHTRRVDVAWGASALLLATLMQAAVFRYVDVIEPAQPWIVALLGHATLVTVAGVAVRRRMANATSNIPLFQSALFQSALATSVVAAGVLAGEALGATRFDVSHYAMSAYLAWTAALWLVLALAANWTTLFAAFQLALYLSLASAVGGALERRDWYATANRGWLDPWALETQGIALAGYCSLWSVLRLVTRKLTSATESISDTITQFGEALRAQTSAVDRVLEVVAVVLLLGVVVYGVAPGAIGELAPTARADRVAAALDRMETGTTGHLHATDQGAWLLITAVAVMVAVGLWYDLIRVRTVALTVLVGAACALSATWWEGQNATASALRWSLAGYALLASLPIWARQHVRSIATRLGIGEKLGGSAVAMPSGSIDAAVRATIIVVVVLSYAAMGVYVGSAAVAQAGVPAGMYVVLYWLAGVCALALIVALVLMGIERGVVDTALSANTGDSAPTKTTALGWAKLVSQSLLMMGLAPLAAASIFVVADALRQYPIVGPSAESWFATAGLSVSYGVPIVGLVVALLGHGVRERSSQYTLAAALLVNVTVTTVYLIQRAGAGLALTGEAWVQLAQLNVIAVALYSLVWLTVWSRYRSGIAPDDNRPLSAPPPSLLGTYIAFGAALCGAVVIWAAAYLSVYPDAPAYVAVAGSGWGWTALVLNAVCVVWLARRYDVRHTLVTLSGVLGLAASMVAFTVAQRDSGDWLAYHTLLAGFAVAAISGPTLARIVAGRDDWRLTPAGVRMATLFAAITVLLSLRALDGDPRAPWWTVGGLAAMAMLSAVLAWEAAQRRFVWAAGLLLNLAASIWWVEEGYQLFAGATFAQPRDFFYINVIAAAVSAVYSVIVLRRRIEPREQAGTAPRLDMSLHRFTVWAMLAVMTLLVAAGLAADVARASLGDSKALAGMAVAAVVVACAARLWDTRSRFTVACLYMAGAIGMGALIDALDVRDSSQLLWTGTQCAAAYALLTSYLWSRRGELAASFAALGVPLAVETHTQWSAHLATNGADSRADQPNWVGHTWLVTTNGLVAWLVTMAVFWIECTYTNWADRNAAAYALAALTFALALLARGARRTPLQYTSLVWGVLFAVAWGLSWLQPDVMGPVVNRLIVAVVALAVATVLYGFGLVKLWRAENEWTRAAERLVPSLVACGSALLVAVLSLEVYHFFDVGDVPVTWPARIAVAIALAATGAAALVAAIVPGRDPLGLSESGRTAYVYAAEVIAALLFVHVRVTVPELFRGWFLQFWPLVAMGVAFVGVGFSEWCARRRQQVLSQPLERTAALMPILPLLGFWVVDSQVNFSLLLLTIGALYATLAVLRRSFGFSILAVLAANGSLWRLLGTHEGLGLAEHPQLWLIPPALCVLVASYLNRGRLSGQQMTSIRYLSAIVIYASSTADVFLNGVAAAPWLPGVLAALAIAGIFAGIILHVRAFLYLGTTFLVVSLMTVIWHAAVELSYTWIWYVTGIVAGLLILALFGLFEKRRDDMLRVVDNLRQWDA